MEVLCKKSNKLVKTPFIYNMIMKSAKRNDDLYGDTELMMDYYHQTHKNHIYVNR
jgi:hypothetical protein